MAVDDCGGEVIIQALLSAPNPDDPLSDNIAKHWKTNEAEAVETANYVRSNARDELQLSCVIGREPAVMMPQMLVLLRATFFLGDLRSQ
ncbi:hypothetical protein MUK42_29704 [Musa troglodytarum]|uniref:Uncharacterized protein n=1 Tax=Musa troglodytarum TaxID=320322 RepID=A0A9E7JL59_9LILI|nr:hypothetical protein MUK42_29704 [Musa troglodytarum]